MPNQPDDCWTFCREILPDVSRSFALIIPLCPDPIDRALCVAYLICRIADTVEDEPALTPADRDGLYDALLIAVDTPHEAAANEFVQRWRRLPDGDYGRLVANTHCVLAAYASLPESCRDPIRGCVHAMVAGMRRLQPVEVRGPVAYFCRDLGDLDQYCHYVAGTVGIMSTALFESRFNPSEFAAGPSWHEQGRRLGLGLQMTNIIKDCRSDADRGVSYIPPCYVDFDSPRYQLLPSGRTELVRHAVGHLDAGLAYVQAVPAAENGIRSFLLGALLPAIATLEVAVRGPVDQPKITRDQMAQILTLIGSQAADDAAVTGWYEQHRAATLDSSPRSRQVDASSADANAQLPFDSPVR